MSNRFVKRSHLIQGSIVCDYVLREQIGRITFGLKAHGNIDFERLSVEWNDLSFPRKAVAKLRRQTSNTCQL